MAKPRFLLPLLLLLGALCPAVPALAGPFGDGLAAAKRGDAPAQFNLGLAYARGQGVPQDDAKAYIWFDLAAARLPPGPHQQVAARDRDLMAAKLTPQALARVQAAAEAFHPAPPAPVADAPPP